MIAKKESLRLPGKNMKDFNGVPMFLWNLKKLVCLFDTVVFDSDCVDMCALAAEAGAHISLREQNLRGNDVPSVPILLSVINKFPDFDKLISLQANSPHTSLEVIDRCSAKLLMGEVDEVLTRYENGKINGSVWGLSRYRLHNYGDFYSHSPDVLVVDDSIDIHTYDDYINALSAFYDEFGDASYQAKQP